MTFEECIQELLNKIDNLKTAYSTYFTDAQTAELLHKTFQSHNITIENWNSLTEYVKNLSDKSQDLPTVFDEIVSVLNFLGDQLEASFANLSGEPSDNAALNTALSLKLSKVSSNISPVGYDRVYAINLYGGQKTLYASHTPNANSLVQFDEYGHISVQTPSGNNNPTPKSYVDNITGPMQEQINNLKARGRFLSLWDTSTGTPYDDPQEMPYEIKTGDYFIIGSVSEGGGPYYRPDFDVYEEGTRGETEETEEISVDDVYYFDGTNWQLQINTRKEVRAENVIGLDTLLDGKLNKVTDSTVAPQAYVKATNGSQTMMNIVHESFSGGTLVQRTSDGNVRVGTASNGNDAISLNYLNTQILRGVVVMNAPANLVLTQDEFNIITSGKTVKIIGSFLELQNPIIVSTQMVPNTSIYEGLLLGTNSSGISFIRKIQINANKTFSAASVFAVDAINRVYLYNLSQLNSNDRTISFGNIATYKATNNVSSATLATVLKNTEIIKNSTAMTSLVISGLTNETNEPNPSYQISFTVGTNMTITLPVGITWKNGLPTLVSGDKWNLTIEGEFAYLW